MTPGDRTRALDAAHHGLLWLTEPYSPDHPDRTRWGMAHHVLADTTTALVLDQDRHGDDGTGRRSIGPYSDPTGQLVAAAANTAAHQQQQRATLAGHETTIAELARWIRATLQGDPHPGPDSIYAATADVAWATQHHTAVLASIDPANSLIADINDAIATLHTTTKVTIGHTRAILQAAVREKPDIRQPKLGDCRAHEAAGQHIPATHGGLCETCADFRRLHRCPPTPEIIRAWDYGRRRLTPTMIEQARTQHRQKRRRR